MAVGLLIFPAAVLSSVGPSIRSADSHVLWSRHLLLCRRHGADGIYREAEWGAVRLCILLQLHGTNCMPQ